MEKRPQRRPQSGIALTRNRQDLPRRQNLRAIGFIQTLRKWLKPRQMETERPDPPSRITVIWNAAAALLAMETDPAKRGLLFEITGATTKLVKDLLALAAIAAERERLSRQNAHSCDLQPAGSIGATESVSQVPTQP